MSAPTSFNDIILYNGINPFSGICGTPLVQINDQFIKYGEQWGVKNTITLTSTITGGCNYFNQIISGQASIINAFSQDFQSLQIIESGVTIFNKPYCEIKSINFPDSQYLKLLPFTIEIDCYESGFFSGYYGVLEPKNEWTIVQEKDQSLRFEHTVSCRGFNTSSGNANALQNARNFIGQYSGLGTFINPYFIQICSGITPSLIESSENINRNVGTYSVIETYIAEPNYNSGVLRFTTVYDSGIDLGISTLKVNGSVRTAKNYPLSTLRGRYSGFSILSAALEAYSGATNGMNDLNPLYTQSGVVEDPFSLTLNFSVDFNNDVTPSPYLDYKISFDQDDLTSITKAKFDGTVKARGELSQKWLAVQSYASGVNMYAITANEYIVDNYQYILNPNAITQSVTQNPYIAEINLSATFDDKVLPPSGIDFLDYTLNVTPAITKINATPILNGSGNFYVVNLGYANRSIVKIGGQAVVDLSIPVQSGVSIISNYLNWISSQYVTGNRVCLEEQVLNQGNAGVGRNIGFDGTWSFEGTIFNP